MAKKKSDTTDVPPGYQDYAKQWLQAQQMSQQWGGGPVTPMLGPEAYQFATQRPEMMQTGTTYGQAVPFVQQLLGPGTTQAQAKQLYEQWAQARQWHTQGLAGDPGTLQQFAQSGGLGGAAGGLNDPLNPVVRAQFLAKVYQPWAAQQAQQEQSQLAGLGNQMQAALNQYGKNLPPGYANMFNLNNRQLLGAAQAVAGAGTQLANITNNPMAQLIAQQMQADTAARTKAYMEQRTALSNALSSGAGGGLGNIIGGAAAAGSTLSPQVNIPQVANPKTP